MSSRARRIGVVLTGLALFAAVGPPPNYAGQMKAPGQLKADSQKVQAAAEKVFVRGHVKVPDGRPLQGIRLTLHADGEPTAIDLDDLTNVSGFYSIPVARTLVGRTFQLTPAQTGASASSFTPARRVFGLTASPGPLDFVYSGPLPDLTCSQANLFFEMEGQSRHYYIQVTVLNRIASGQGLASGPFKARATYEDRTVTPWALRQLVFSVPGLGMGLTHVEKHVSVGVYPPQAFFRLVKVEVDFENAVVERDEANNTRTFN